MEVLAQGFLEHSSDMFVTSSQIDIKTIQDKTIVLKSRNASGWGNIGITPMGCNQAHAELFLD